MATEFDVHPNEMSEIIKTQFGEMNKKLEKLNRKDYKIMIKSGIFNGTYEEYKERIRHGPIGITQMG